MVTARQLFAADDLLFAALDCPPGDPEWGEDNLVTHPIVALPSVPVWQVQDGERRLVDPTDAIFHHDGSEYRREPFEGRAYRCLFFFADPGLAREVAADFDPGIEERDRFAFRRRTGPMDGQAFAASRRLARALVTCGMDRLEAHERLLAILRAAIGGTYRQNRSPARRSTGRAHLAIVGETRAELVRRMADPITLADLARSVHVSPYHLARVFRQETGRSIHELLRELRLRTALERLDGERRLNVGTVAAEVGFAGHSHFTAAFREAFGTPPSQFRSAVQGRSATISPSRDIA